MSQIFFNDRAVFFNDRAVDYDSSVQTTEILWDDYGVPHVYAQTEEDMYYGFGWSQMKSHANNIIRLYAQARGRAAEYLGQSQFESDRKVHQFNIPQIANDEYNSYSQQEKSHIDGFVKGLNDWASLNLSNIDASLRPVLPIVPQDVISHSKRVIWLEFVGGGAIGQAGSNAYAVSPQKTSTGNAMLVINPHLPWSDYYLFFEAHLNAGDFNMYGATLIGLPILMLGFNNYLGWTHTVNTIDAADTYRLTLSGGGYALDGSTHAFNQRTVSIGVRQGNGSVQYQNVVVKESQHGPVLRETGSQAFAVRIAGLQNQGLFAQFKDMARSQNLSQFESVLSRLQIPMFNVIYADKNGDIMYLFNGNVPVKSSGDWNFWGGIIDGTQSQYIWNSIHPYEDLPKVINPSTGWVQNANDTPWSCTYPFQLNANDYPSYMAPYVGPIGFRAQRSINLMKDRQNISFDDLVDIKLDTGMEVADRFLPTLLNAVAQQSNPTATQAAAILQNWDGRTDTDSVGAVIYDRWYKKLNNSMFANQWNISNPVSTPSGLSNPSQAVTLLATAATETQNLYGSMDVTWGDVHKFRQGSYTRPANGADDALGVYRTMYYSTDPATNISYAWHGETFISVVEFGDTVKAKAILAYGNATQPGNPFVGSQIPQMSENTLRDVLLVKNDVLNNLYQREVLIASS